MTALFRSVATAFIVLAFAGWASAQGNPTGSVEGKITDQDGLALPGVTNKMDGTKDAYLNEAGRVARYKVRDAKELGTWFPQGPVINKEGSLGTYKKFKDQTG